ncbi:DUF6631 family protein [Lysobacter antibioticus]|jgi:hypothetical protein|uniref:Uncharacterized protein n=1 Tax=Lysobacter antibioticus TaxID=84531 RepID=A0A0S2F4W7_LYSAN|nr:DUF6631 family protein [Lysobacter antibioticus]ALN78597.1 hypothetical protein LA76x_0436 [Lysobacter antibioticus]
MARKIKRPESPPADDLIVLQPNRVLPLGDRTVTVREMGFFESLRLHSEIAALVADLVEQTDDGNIDLGRLHRVCAQHPDATVELLAQVSDQSVEFVHSLNAAQGDLLLLTFWAVNADFFLQRVIAALELRRAAPAATGPASSPP